MRSVKSKNTKPELIIRKTLTRLGYRYRLHSRDIPGKPDISFKNRKKVMFVNGCFWHGHNRCSRGLIADTEFWRKKILGNIERDKTVLTKLNEQGWKALTIWQCELKNIALIELKLISFLGNPSLSSSANSAAK